MTQIINKILAPIDKWISKNRKYIGFFLIFLSFCSFGFFFFPLSTKDSGEKAILVLWIILWIPIFTRVFGIDLFKTLLPLRKELGILMGTLAFVHGAGYLFQFPSFILEKSFWWDQGFFTYLATGFFALILSMPLTLTSSNWAIKKL
jgi:DMSO/TMAO reductase YedYZ heme-binding membrane subunit